MATWTDEELLWWVGEFKKLPGLTQSEIAGCVVVATLGEVGESRVEELMARRDRLRDSEEAL